jgi:RNA polymerase sigma-70 factor (ECF subfamily)
MHSESDLEILMARYQQGDYAAATALIHQLSAQLHRFFLSSRSFSATITLTASCTKGSPA